MTRLLLCVSVLTGSLATAGAQSFFTGDTPQFFTPGWRPATRAAGATAEFSSWDVFYEPRGGLNYPDMAAPAGGVQSGSEYLPVPASEVSATTFPLTSAANPSARSQVYAFWSTENPTVRQTNASSGAFIVSPGVGGNIYSFSAATAYTVADSTPFTLGSVLLQFQTDGSLIDLSSLVLRSGSTTYAATNYLTEYKASSSTFGGLTNRVALQWNLTGRNISNYTIEFGSISSSNSLQLLTLDTTNTYQEIVPGERAWQGAAGGAWSSAANWSGGTLPAPGGNLAVATGSSLVIDGGTREVGRLKLAAPGGFSLNRTGDGILKLNTGVQTVASAPATYEINTPIVFGAYNLSEIAPGTVVNFNQPLSGDTGLGVTGVYDAATKASQGGTVRLNGSNTFTGSLSVSGNATVEVAGSNSYGGGTAITQGTMVVKAAAPALGEGALGNGGTILVGVENSTSSVSGSALLIEGAYQIGREVTLQTGLNAKVLGGRQTGAGATFSGPVTLNSGASNVQLEATGAADVVSFTGALTGGGSTGTLLKTGAGRVVLGGGTAKDYANSTTVQTGTLEIAGGTSFTSAGAVTVSSGARLVVQGTLGGAGALSLSGGTLGGNGTINRTFTVDSGDRLAPGASVGTLKTVSQKWDNGGRLQLEIADAAGAEGTGWDLVQLTGTLDLAATGGGFTLELQSLTAAGGAGLAANFNAGASRSWRFATTTGGITSFAAGDFTVDTSGFANALNGGTFAVTQSGNDLFLNYQAVPEPSAVALLLAGAAGWAGRRRRR